MAAPPQQQQQQRNDEAVLGASLLRRYAGTLTGDHVSRIFNTENYASAIARIGPPPARFLITVRNLRTDEQYMHPTPVDTLAGWQRYFLEQPIFRKINFAKETFFPDLAAPVARAFEITRFNRGGDPFAAIVTRAAPTAAVQPSLTTDWVQVYMCPPPLPMDHNAFLAVAENSSHLRRAYAFHLAACAMALQSNLESMAIAPPGAPGIVDDYDPSLLHGDRVLLANSMFYFRYAGSFAPAHIETTTGSEVIPHVLQFARFLQPLVDPKTPVHYDIVQAHRYGYMFQIQSVGGWRIMGSVNMYASFDELRAQLPPTPTDVGTVTALQSATNIPTNAAIMTRTNQQLLATIRATKAGFDAACAPWHGTDAVNAAPFWNAATNTPNIMARTTDLQKRALPTHVWNPLVTFAGLTAIQRAMLPKMLVSKYNEQTQRGNRFLDAWLASMVFPTEQLQNNTSIISTVDVAQVLYDVCLGLAEITLLEFNTITPVAANQTALSLGASLMRRDPPIIPIAMDRLIPIARGLRGKKPPSKWASHLVRTIPEGGPIISATVLARNLLHNTMLYANFLQPLLDHTIDKKPREVRRFLQCAKVHSPTIKAGFDAAVACHAAALTTTAAADKATVTNALAYALFTNNTENGVDQWT